MRRFPLIVLLIAGCAVLAGPARAVSPTDVVLPNTPAPEVEPNGTAATATPFAASGRMRGMILPNGDVDLYSFAASAGERVYAATMTSASASNNVDSTLALLGSDGTTVIESDLSDGSFGATASRNRPVARGAKVTLRLKVPKKAQTAIRRALRRKKKVRASISVSARDAAGNVATAKRKIRLKR